MYYNSAKCSGPLFYIFQGMPRKTTVVDTFQGNSIRSNQKADYFFKGMCDRQMKN